MNKIERDFDEKIITITKDFATYEKEERENQMLHEKRGMSDVFFKLNCFLKTKSNIREITHEKFLEYMKSYRNDIYLLYFDDVIKTIKSLVDEDKKNESIN